VKLYYDVFHSTMGSAERDWAIQPPLAAESNSEALPRPDPHTTRWILTDEQVLRLFDAVPERHHAAVWLGAAHGCRIGEVLGSRTPPAASTSQTVSARGLAAAVRRRAYAGFLLKETKGGSIGAISFDREVQSGCRKPVRRHRRRTR